MLTIINDILLTPICALNAVAHNQECEIRSISVACSILLEHLLEHCPILISKTKNEPTFLSPLLKPFLLAYTPLLSYLRFVSKVDHCIVRYSRYYRDNVVSSIFIKGAHD